MDIVTHGLLGALVAQSLSRSRSLRAATVVGALAALLPDLDVLIQSADDPLLVLEYHRHFTHSLFFAPVVALVGTFLCTPLLRQDFSRPHLYLLILLAYLSACVLDACTSYGTHLLWPLFVEPVALNIIAIVDPVFSALLLIAVFAAWWGRKRNRARVGLLLAIVYLAIGWVQNQRAETAAIALVEARALAVTSLQVKPTLGNLLLWRSIAVTKDQQLQVDAIRVGIDDRVYVGERRHLVALDELQAFPRESRAYRDLQRYQRLNQPLLISHSGDQWMFGDARYAMLPTLADPLWGLKVNPHQPNAVPEFVTMRKLTPAMRQTFIDMLLGRDLRTVVDPAVE